MRLSHRVFLALGLLLVGSLALIWADGERWLAGSARAADPPVISGSRSPAANANGWNNTNVTVTFTCTAAAGIKSITASGAASGSSTTSPLQVTVTTEGTNQSVTGTCTDNDDVSRQTTVSGISIDKTNPVISGSRSPAANADGWNNTNVTVTFTCSDARSGVNSISASGAASGNSTTSPLNVTVSSEGENQSVNGTCTDQAGNSAGTSVTGISIDKTDPVISGTRHLDPNASGWFDRDVPFSFSCTDALSGLKLITASGNASGSSTTSPLAVAVTSEGTNRSVTGTCTDKAGNDASTSFSGLNIDKTPPTINASISPAANSNGWYKTDPTVTITCSDSLSGVSSLSALTNGAPSGNSSTSPLNVTVSSEGANQSVTGTCTDNAGGSSSATISNINIDKTNPSITALRRPGPDENGWNNRDVTVRFVCSDSLSGVNSIVATGDASGSTNASPLLLTLNSDGADQSVTGTCTDNADNSASATIEDINIDKTPPSITINTPASGGEYGRGEAVAADYSCTDALSGIASCTGSVPSGENISTTYRGPHFFLVRASDQAGNSAFVFVIYRVR